MRTVGVQELKEHAGEILRELREEGEGVEITYRGRTVARLVPVEEPNPLETVGSRTWCDLDHLIQEIEEPWPDEVIAPNGAEYDRHEG